MPKRDSASSSAAPTKKRAKGAGEERTFVYICRWARCTDVEDLDQEKIQAMECDLSEIHACIKEELDSVLEDEQGVDGAFLSVESAVQVRDELMKQKMEEAKEAVRNSYSLSEKNWKKLLKSSWVSESSDTQTFGVEYQGPGEPTPHQDLAWMWANRSPAVEAAAPTFTFHDAQHNVNDPLQTHYELAWGSLDGNPVCKIEEEAMIQCCVTILTRIRCWVERVPLKG